MSIPSEEYLETTEKCLVETVLSPLDLHHTLSVQVMHTPRMCKKIRVCKGHYREEKSNYPQADKRNQKRAFNADPTIKSFDVSIDKAGIGHRDLIISQWVHIDNAHTCNSFEEREQEETPESWEEIDTWQMENQKLLDSLDCTVVNITTGQPETRLINGREVTRPFWSKTHHLQCLKKHQNGCNSIKENNCILTSNECIKKVDEQCLVWEKTFKCRKRKAPTYVPELKDIYGADQAIWETTYQPNQDFSDMATKLAVFDEMKKELQNSNSSDVRSVRLFKGSDQQCSKSIAEDLMYDCCFDMGGFATQIKLSKCSADEIALAESRRKGLTHYIGVKKEKFLGLWVSRKEHVFCVFPSKLSRVFQEEARKQLNLTWGDADNPDCRGLSQDEIKKLDFSRINLLEAFETPRKIDSTEKIKNIETRLKQRIENL